MDKKRNVDRRQFVRLGIASTAALLGTQTSSRVHGFTPDTEETGLVDFLSASPGGWSQDEYRKILGWANEFKEGDELLGVAAPDEERRTFARRLLSRTTIQEIDAHPPVSDQLLAYINRAVDTDIAQSLSTWTIGKLKEFLLREEEPSIHSIRPGLSSDVIACVVRLMSNEELIAVGSKVFNPLPGRKLGARGYLGARIQPNSPTDHLDDIVWQVFDAFSYAVGDLLLGTNPVSSDPHSVAAIERALQDIIETFGLTEVLPQCVLAHIDVQSEVEAKWPGSTALWFQSIAGNDDANATFDLPLEKMIQHARSRDGRFDLYFETGQGADVTNGHGHGTDMVVWESRKYGFARALAKEVNQSKSRHGASSPVWVHVNDVAGFIGPEVFRSRDQLVRCCLEDIVMGKLHGLMIGLDVCSTLHMDVTLDDLEWCIDQVVPACPGYLMALPTRIDPMLGYLTTGFHDHVRIREKFGTRVDDRMWGFFQSLGVIDERGRPTATFGDPVSIYLAYCRRRNDTRSDETIRLEGRQRMEEVRARGVFLSEGFGNSITEMQSTLQREVQTVYEDAKKCIWEELPIAFAQTIPNAVEFQSKSADRRDYILHPTTGEQLSDGAQTELQTIRQKHGSRFDSQIVVSDGLNALAVAGGDQLSRLLLELRNEMEKQGFKPAPEIIVLRGGRVRAGYRIGEFLFGDRPGLKRLLHVIGERPGSGHHTLSIYMTSADGTAWGNPNTIDHNRTKVISGIASTALLPELAAGQAITLLRSMT